MTSCGFPTPVLCALIEDVLIDAFDRGAAWIAVNQERSLFSAGCIQVVHGRSETASDPVERDGVPLCGWRWVLVWSQVFYCKGEKQRSNPAENLIHLETKRRSAWFCGFWFRVWPFSWWEQKVCLQDSLCACRASWLGNDGSLDVSQGHQTCRCRISWEVGFVIGPSPVVSNLGVILCLFPSQFWVPSAPSPVHPLPSSRRSGSSDPGCTRLRYRSYSKSLRT